MSNGGLYAYITLDFSLITINYYFSRYEMRRECQEILPGLLLGPFQASKSFDTLKKLQVTHMYAPSYSVMGRHFMFKMEAAYAFGMQKNLFQ